MQMGQVPSWMPFRQILMFLPNLRQTAPPTHCGVDNQRDESIRVLQPVIARLRAHGEKKTMSTWLPTDFLAHTGCFKKAVRG